VRAAGIRVRHARSCRSREGARCNCRPRTRRGSTRSANDKKIRKTFKSLAEARSWRADAESAVRKQTLRAPSKLTVRQAAEDWLEGARADAIRNRSGHTTSRVRFGPMSRHSGFACCPTLVDTASPT
jgi:integrase